MENGKLRFYYKYVQDLKFYTGGLCVLAQFGKIEYFIRKRKFDQGRKKKESVIWKENRYLKNRWNIVSY